MGAFRTLVSPVQLAHSDNVQESHNCTARSQVDSRVAVKKIKATFTEPLRVWHYSHQRSTISQPNPSLCRARPSDEEVFKLRTPSNNVINRVSGQDDLPRYHCWHDLLDNLLRSEHTNTLPHLSLPSSRSFPSSSQHISPHPKHEDAHLS